MTKATATVKLTASVTSEDGETAKCLNNGEAKTIKKGASNEDNDLNSQIGENRRHARSKKGGSGKERKFLLNHKVIPIPCHPCVLDEWTVMPWHHVQGPKLANKPKPPSRENEYFLSDTQTTASKNSWRYCKIMVSSQ